MMVASEEEIKRLQGEVLRLKLELHHKERQNGPKTGGDLDETKRDLIADLMTANEELRTQLQEIQKPEMVDVACQTGLDRFGIDKLMEDSLTLKKQKMNQQKQPQQQQQPLKPEYTHNREYQNLISNKYMNPDEKETLDKLFKLDGMLTIARDKLRALALN